MGTFLWDGGSSNEQMRNHVDGINLNDFSYRTNVKVRQRDKRHIQLLQLIQVKRGRRDGCDDDESESDDKVKNEYDIRWIFTSTVHTLTRKHFNAFGVPLATRSTTKSTLYIHSSRHRYSMVASTNRSTKFATHDSKYCVSFGDAISHGAVDS